MSGMKKAISSFPQAVGFSVEYYDPVADLLRTFVLTVFPDQKVQMVSGNKTFLSKTYAKELETTDLYIGGTIVLFSRELSIVDYADESTRKYFEGLQSRCFVMILPTAMGSLGEIISIVQGGDAGYGSNGRSPSVISNAKMFRLDERRGRSGLPALEDALPRSGVAVAMEVIADSRQGGFEGLQGIVDGLRQQHGSGIFASNTPREALEHARRIFHEEAKESSKQTNNPRGKDHGACTLCVVKPHVVRDGKLGAVLSFATQKGFEVTGLQMLYVGEVGAEELLRPYRGVVSYHADAVRHLNSGPCVALKIQGGENVVEEFREACGPADPEVAKALYPDSLRALLGVEQATNAVHCTDLPEDGLLECQYMFDVVANGLQQALTSRYNTINTNINTNSSTSGSNASRHTTQATQQQQQQQSVAAASLLAPNSACRISTTARWTNQDLRSSQPPRAREPHLATSLSRLWSEGFPLSFPRRRQETGGNGTVQGEREPRPQHGGRVEGGEATAENVKGYRQEQAAFLQPRQPRRFVLRQRQHQPQRRSALAGSLENGSGGGAREGEPTQPPLLPPLRLSVQYLPRKTVLLRQLRRRRLLKRLLSSSPSRSPR
eukprot:g10697.t1